MKHTTEELLFAAAVRERVRTLRTAKTADMTPEQRKEFDAKPANDLVEEVMREFDGIANVIAQIRARP